MAVYHDRGLQALYKHPLASPLLHTKTSLLLIQSLPMAGKSLALYTGSSSTYDLEGVPSLANQPFLTNEQVVEEARAIIMKPLAILPPQKNGASQGSVARSVAPGGRGKVKRMYPYRRSTTGTLALKKKLPEDGTPGLQSGEKYKGSLVTPLGNVCFHSYSSSSLPPKSPLRKPCFT